MRRVATLLLAALAAGGCAATKRPASLAQAQQLLQVLAASGAEQRVEAEMIKTRQAIGEAEAALQREQHQDYVNGLAHLALRQAQVAQAEDQRRQAQAAADSLKTARLNRLLSLSEAQRAQLQQQQQLSEEEIAQLRQRNVAVTQQADSLRRAAEEANRRLDSALTQLRTLVAEITNIRETTRGLVISLSDILFDVNKATLKSGAAANVGRIAAILNQYPDYRIAVEGHTDATGSDSYNQDLSERRAAAVREALVAGGVDASRITSQGFGESQPVATNASAAGRQQNRRVEVIVLGAGSLAAPGGQGAGTSDTTRTPPP